MSSRLAIGTFAQIGGVSVRTLRHYDAVGLLRPAGVDASSGYRSYEPRQLVDLNRILVLKELGFTLTEITRFLETEVSADQLLGMLRLRRAEAERALVDERKRLDHVAARIKLIEGDHTMSTAAVVVKSLPAIRLACVSEPAAGFDAEFGPIFGRLYPVLYGELGVKGVVPTGPSYALYGERADGQIDVIAASPIASDALLTSDVVTTRDLTAVSRAATLVHHGPMTTIQESYGALMSWISDAGEEAVGYSREVYLAIKGDPAGWVTELQFILK